MKKVLLLLSFLVAFFVSNAQYPVVQFLGRDSALVDSRGGFKARLINYAFTDTTEANTQRISQYPGAFIYTTSGGDKLWLRNSTATAWDRIGTASGGGGGIVSLGASAYGLIIQNDSTYKVDTILLSTKLWRQKGIDSVQSNVNLKLNITDTANMRPRLYAGSNVTISGTYPNLTIASTGGGVSDTSVFIVDTLYNRIATTINADSLRLKSLRIQNGGVAVTPETTDSTVSWSIRSDTTFSKPLIGDIYYDTLWTNLTDFVDTSLASISGGKIVMAQDATFSTSIKLSQKTMLDDDSIQVRVVWNTQATNNYGPFLTWTSTNTTVTTASVFGGLNLYPSGADYGKIQITDNYTGSTYTQSTAALSTTTVGDTLLITFANRKGVFALTVENETKGITSTFTVTNSFTYGGQAIGHNTGRVGFKQHNGSYTILSFKHASKQTFRPAKLFVGDSKAAGSYAGSASARYSELQGGENSAGGGDKTAEVISRLTEIGEVIKPQTLYLEIGANDRFQGVAVSTIMTNIDSIVRYCEARGIAVRPMCPAPNNSTSMLALKDSIIARYPSTYIDLYTPMLGSGSNLAAAYNAGDGVHLNAAGNLKIDSLINSSGRSYVNNAYVDTYLPGDGISFTKEESGNYRTFTISANSQAASTASAAVDSTTVPLITFSAGAGFASDTAMVTDSSLFGSIYTGQYEFTIKEIRAVIKGNAGDSIVLKIVYNDTFNVDGTKINGAGLSLNNRYTGNTFTVTTSRTVPVNSWLWVKPEAVIAGKKPKYISITLLGYKTYVAP